MNDLDIRAQARWAKRFTTLAQCAAIVSPKDELAKDLRRQAQALHAATGAGAARTTLVLISQCRKIITEMNRSGEADDFLEAFTADARDALNRLANMIRRGDPSPTEPKEAVDASR